MKFTLTNIDPQNCSIEELEQEIIRLKALKEEYYNLEQSIKIWINSCYGAMGSAYFEGYNVNVAEAVTLQGQDVAKYASKAIDEYFFEYWHNDKKLHEALGITHANKITEKTLTIYMDTDSCYVTFDPVLKSCDYKGKQVDFILKIKELRLNAYLKKKFEEYAAKYNTTNIQDLELEKISYSAIMVAKKKYILDLAWKDPGVFIEPQAKIKFVGVEIMQGSTPKFARKVLKEMIKMACEKGKNIQYADVVKRLKEYKKEYVLQNPDDVAKTQSLGDYEKYCLEDKKQIRLAEKCGQNVRASAVYNHIILNSPKWKTKYNLIKTGDKVKYYYTKDGNEVFGFLPGNFPYEFAPTVDYDLQFEKTIVEPFNRILTSMGFNPVPGNLIYARSLF
jgi:DNA polymerase elongation subunit (family B)